MEDYKPNSNRFKEEQKQNKEHEKRVEKPVVKGKVVTKKPSKLRKLTGEFISDEAKNVKSYVIGEVIIPAVKKAISDVVVNGIDMILYGETRGGNRRSTADRVSYTKYSDRDYGARRSNISSVSSAYSYNDVILHSRGEAEDVLARMDELMDTYGLVRVADLYDLVGITGNYTDNKYGWTNIRNADIVRVRDGYQIRMPRAVPID